jgi:hypothetical protein
MTTLSGLEFYLCPLRQVPVFHGQVNGAPADPYINIDYDNGATGTGAPLYGMTISFGSTPSGTDIGYTRLFSWTPATATTGAFRIAETDDIGPQIANDQYVTIWREFRLWPIVPRFILSGETVTSYEDYDIAYNDQTVDWYPKAVAPPPAVAFLVAGSVVVDFVGEYSQAMAPGASLSSFLWTAPGSSEVTSTSEGTTGSPVQFTYTSPGQYMVSFRVTDSNGNTDTQYTWVFVVNPSNPDDEAYILFDALSDSNSRDQQGGETSFTVYGVGSVLQFPRDGLVCVGVRGTLTTRSYGTFPGRDNTLFTGYIIGNSISQNPRLSTVTFRAVGVHHLMRNTNVYPISMTDGTNPSAWEDGNRITVDRLVSYIARWRSTLGLMTPIIFSGYSGFIQRQDLGPSTLLQQMQSELLDDAWIKVTVSYQGVLYLDIEYNWMLTGERAAAAVGKTLHKGIWLDDVTIEERSDFDFPTAKIKADGVWWPGNSDDLEDAVPLFSEAPGEVNKPFGNESGRGGFILAGADDDAAQTDLNIRCGFMLARENMRWPTVRMRFLNDGGFDVAPQTVFPAIIEPTDNNRGLSWTPNLLPRSIRRTYGNSQGMLEIEVEFEPDSTGPPGVTVPMPQTPPTQYFPPVIPEWPTTDLGIATWSPESGMYYRGLGGTSWENRNTGLTGSDLNDYMGNVDPWWWNVAKANTFNPDSAIFFSMPTGKILRSVNAGRVSWQDITPPTGTNASDIYAGAVSDVFTNAVHYFLKRLDTDGSGTFTSGLYKTEDDGLTYTYAAVP